MPTPTRKAPAQAIRVYRVLSDAPLPTKAEIQAMAAALLAGDCRVPRPAFYSILAAIRALTPGDTATLANQSTRRVARADGLKAATVPATREGLGRPRKGENAPRIDQSRANTLTATVRDAFPALYPHVLIVCEDV